MGDSPPVAYERWAWTSRAGQPLPVKSAATVTTNKRLGELRFGLLNRCSHQLVYVIVVPLVDDKLPRPARAQVTGTVVPVSEAVNAMGAPPEVKWAVVGEIVMDGGGVGEAPPVGLPPVPPQAARSSTVTTMAKRQRSIEPSIGG